MFTPTPNRTPVLLTTLSLFKGFYQLSEHMSFWYNVFFIDCISGVKLFHGTLQYEGVSYCLIGMVLL